MRSVGTTRPNTTDKEISFKANSINFLKILLNSFLYFFQSKNKVKYLILNHPRKKKIGNSFVDIYTDPIIDQLNSSYLVLEGLFQLKHLKPSYQKKILYADLFDFWPRLISLFWTPKFTTKELFSWMELKKDIFEIFGVHIDIKKRVEQEYTRCIISVWGLKKLLKKLKPDIIIEVVGYNRLNKHVNIAAKEMSIPTVELQHGYISKKHIAYNFPEGLEMVKTFPNYIALWGGVYKESISVPINKDRLLVSGFKFFENFLIKPHLNEHTGSKILFISQGTIGKELGKLAKDLSETIQNENFEIVYKLHPGEVQDAKKRYAELYKVPNIQVDDKLSSNLYKTIATASVVIGVYSTALLEAASLGKNVIVVKLPGWDGLKELIENPDLPISSAEVDSKSLAITLRLLIKDNKIQPKNNRLIEAYDSTFIEKVI
mgnify:CR=1 FL=1